MSSPEVVEAAAALLGPRVQVGVALGIRTTYRVGGVAALLVTVNGEDDLDALSEAVRATGVETLVVGKGSNLLVADGGFAGLAVVLGEAYGGVKVEGTTVRAGGAAALPVVARQSTAAGLTGFEWAVGVPGSIGGAVRMNAGGHGSDMAATLVGVRVVDLRTGEDREVPAASLLFDYRRSSIARDHLVLQAEMLLARDHQAAGAATLAEIVTWRRAHQPGGTNAGSVFTNPPGDSAGRLIEAAGGKGLRIGTAAVSVKHANFIQADDNGRADDVYSLMLAVQAMVREHAGVELRPETQLVGFDPIPNAKSKVEG